MTDEWFNPRTVLEVYAERMAMQANIPDVLDYNFPKQANFIKDPSNKKVLFCTRRSAKSYTAGLYLIQTALKYPGCNCIFIGLTRASAEAIVWKDILKVINEKHKLNIDFNEAKLRAKFPNGSAITLTGVDVDENEMKKLLGIKFKLVCIDESSMYTISLSNLIDMIEPNTIDERGTICLFGTASDLPIGIFYDITTGARKDWPVFEWSAHDNPYVAKQWQEKLDEIAKLRPEYMDTPQFKQWYLNLWITDKNKLVYRFDIQKNLIKELPKNLSIHGWVYILGVDTGWEDDSAFTLTCYHENDPHLYVVGFFKKKHMVFEDKEGRADCGVVDKIREFMEDKLKAPVKVIIDGANKQGVESMKQRSSIPFEYADKNDKATFIELFNSDMQQSKILFLDTPEIRPLWQEMLALVWVTDGDKIKYPKKEHPSLPNHGCDSILYNWRCGFHYHARPAEKKIIKGSREWYEQQSQQIWEREREQLERTNEWGEMGSLGDM